MEEEKEQPIPQPQPSEKELARHDYERILRLLSIEKKRGYLHHVERVQMEISQEQVKRYFQN